MENKVYKCLECNKTLRSFHCLIVHLKKSHPSKSFFLHNQAQDEKVLKHKCEKCNRQFSSLNFLRLHNRKVHEPTSSSLIVEKVIKQYQCDRCDSHYTTVQNMRSHQLKVHGSLSSSLLPKNLKKNLNCPLCNENLKNDNYILHFESVHDITVISESMQFPTLNDFYIWKENMEIETKSKFKCQRRPYFNSINTKHYFICNRSGNSVSQSKNNKCLKSKKLNGFCPASIQVTENKDGLCNIKFVLTHVGHESELHHLNGQSNSDNSESEKQVKEITRVEDFCQTDLDIIDDDELCYADSASEQTKELAHLTMSTSEQTDYYNELKATDNDETPHYNELKTSELSENRKQVTRIKRLENFCPADLDTIDDYDEPYYADSASGKLKELTHLTLSTSEQIGHCDELRTAENDETPDYNELKKSDVSESGKQVVRIKRLENFCPEDLDAIDDYDEQCSVDSASGQINELTDLTLSTSEQTGHCDELRTAENDETPDYNELKKSDLSESGKQVVRIKRLENFCPEDLDTIDDYDEPCSADSASGQINELTDLTLSTSEQTGHCDELRTTENDETPNYNELKKSDLSESGKQVVRTKRLENFCPEDLDTIDDYDEPCYADSTSVQINELTYLVNLSTSEQTGHCNELRAAENEETPNYNELRTSADDETLDYNELKTSELNKKDSSLSLSEQKSLLQKRFVEILSRINTINDLKLVEKTIDSIDSYLNPPLLNSCNKRQIEENLPSSKTTASERKFYSRKKSKNSMKKSSAIEKEYITIQLLVKN